MMDRNDTPDRPAISMEMIPASPTDGKAIVLLEQRLARGLQFADMLGFTNRQDLQESRVLLHALAELLVSKGVLRLHEIEQRKKEIARYFAEKDGPPKVQLVVTEDKYEPQANTPVDCENRIHLCKARCCKLWFALSVQDLEERIVRWNYAEPYSIAQGSDGYCVHQEGAGSHRCGVYENRPLICRTYSCKDDKRIWLDFEAHVINPDILRDDWPRPASAPIQITRAEIPTPVPPHENSSRM